MIPKIPLLICSAALLYLGGDLFVFNGPLNRALDVLAPGSPRSVAEARKNGIAARVGNRAITTSQLERATIESLWASGKNLASLPPAEQAAARRATLEQLIDDELLLPKISAAGISVPENEIDAALQQLIHRFHDQADFDSALKSQGIPSEKSLRDRVAFRLRAEKFLSSAVSVSVTETEAGEWFAAHEKELAYPERVEARHLFIPTLTTPSEDARKQLEEALAQLTAKQKDFPALAKELSQDPATKDRGGNLGWMTRDRLTPDLAEPVFSLENRQPTLIRSRLGWHLFEVTNRKPAGPRTFESAKAEIIAALETTKREAALAAFREDLRNSGVPVVIYDSPPAPETASTL